MLYFSSLLFIFLFLPVSLLIYYITPARFRKISLLALSVVFCSAVGIYFLCFMILYTAFNYFSGIAIKKIRKRRFFCSVSLFAVCLVDILIFVFFRYAGLSGGNFITGRLAFPLGLSFLTLSAIGYLLDVYSGETDAERNIVNFALYTMMFTKLPGGPISDYGDFITLLKNTGSHSVPKNFSMIGEGAEKFIYGLAKKLIFADNLYMLFESATSGGISGISALSAWIGTISYMLCLYFTLSGISDMGAGLSLCFGYRMPESFNYPFTGAGMRDFGRKWHIPVTGWFKRRIVSPVCDRSDSVISRVLSLIFVWVLLSQWYRAGTGSLVWGLILGTLIGVDTVVRKKRSYKIGGIILNDMILLLISPFFFGSDIKYSVKYLFAMIGGNGIIADARSVYLIRMYGILLTVCVIAAAGVFGKPAGNSENKAVRTVTDIISPVFTVILLVLCVILLSSDGSSDMILLDL